MPDKCTNLTITWFNSPTQGSQNAQMLIDMIQIGQWYGKHQNKDYVLSVMDSDGVRQQRQSSTPIKVVQDQDRLK